MFFICACLALSSSTPCFCWTNQSFNIFFVHICTREWIKHFDFFHFNMGFCACTYWVWPLKIVSILPKCGNISIHTLPKIGEYNYGLPKPYYPSTKNHNVIICEPYWDENNLMLSWVNPWKKIIALLEDI
jgi:hypothetical protein